MRVADGGGGGGEDVKVDKGLLCFLAGRMDRAPVEVGKGKGQNGMMKGRPVMG